jgi:hypothetical protein
MHHLKILESPRCIQEAELFTDKWQLGQRGEFMDYEKHNTVAFTKVLTIYQIFYS